MYYIIHMYIFFPFVYISFIAKTVQVCERKISLFSSHWQMTVKNVQCMRALLNLAHCHGGVLGTAWYMTLVTLQHLTQILGLKLSSGGSNKTIQANEIPNLVSVSFNFIYQNVVSFSTDQIVIVLPSLKQWNDNQQKKTSNTIPCLLNGLIIICFFVQIISQSMMADLPVLSTMLSKLFESSKLLDDVSLHHLVDALCRLSTEDMENATNNKVEWNRY